MSEPDNNTVLSSSDNAVPEREESALDSSEESVSDTSYESPTVGSQPVSIVPSPGAVSDPKP